MTKLMANRLERVVKADSITLDRALFNQLVSMLEGLAEIRYMTEDNARHIGILTNEVEALRQRLGDK